jgi:hypothetical protein
VIGKGHQKKPDEDDDIPGDDDDSQPVGKDVDKGQSDECGRKKEFVRYGVEIGSQFGTLMSKAGDEAVDSVRNPCDCKSDCSPPKASVDNEDDEDGNQKNPDKSQDIRQIHGARKFGVMSLELPSPSSPQFKAGQRRVRI